MRPLSLAVAQPACVAYDVAANAIAHAATVRAARSRVVVFPELSLTGYHLDAPVIALDDERLVPIVEACAETGSIALAGAPISGDHIATLSIDATGVTAAYLKVNVDGTEARFTPGDLPAAIGVDDWDLGLAICKDTGIAAHAAATARLGIDIYVAGTLMSVDETEEQNSRARRIATTHGIWVAFASFAGSTGAGYVHAAGRSGIWAPDGTVMAQAGPEIGAIASAVLAR